VLKVFSRRTVQRLLAVAMVFTVVALATDSVSHWHKGPSDEARCQVCHIGHAAAPGPCAPVAMQVPVPISRFAVTEAVSVHVAPLRAPSIPRAPPA
jgi:hypothetical protein